jgi:hypothetical protein
MADFEQRKISDFEKEKIDKFLEEYLFDLDAKKAAIRVGITPTHADSVAKNWLETQYFQNRYREVTTKQDNLLTDDEAVKNEMKRALLSIIKCENTEIVPPAARIQAMDRLSKLMGLDAKVQQTDTQTVTNVMIVPAPLSVDDWSQQAQLQQAELYKQLEASL